MAKRSTLDFLRTESGSGAILALAALTAIFAANSPLEADYFGLIDAPIPVRLGPFGQTLSVAAWVKDGLMAVFFLVIGLEIKFEVLRGEFSSPRRLALPLLAALGGMVVPALIYLACNLAAEGRTVGWPIPTATDIAFALAGFAIFARRAPSSLRLFLLTLAIADDLGAVTIIAVLFTRDIHWQPLMVAGMTLGGLILLSRWRRAPLMVYGMGFLIVWACTLQAGVNTSLAGIACAFTVPIGSRRADQESVLKTFMDAIHPYVAYLILPLFAFTAAGFSLQGLSLRRALAPMPLGIMLALVIGKPLGVFGFSAAAAAARLGRRPSGASWTQLFGISLLCGAGFTMSLFIGGLAFSPDDLVTAAQIRLAVTVGSVASVVAGGGLLAWTGRRGTDLPDE